MESYFVRTGPLSYRATNLVGGAWTLDEQHVAPALGLLVHVVERDRAARRGDELVLARLSYDILGTLPISDVDLAIDVIRPGRTIELVEARLSHAGRDAVRLRAWLLEPRDTEAVAGHAFPAIPPLAETPRWRPEALWPGDFIASIEVHRILHEAGRGTVWARTEHPLVDDEPVDATARYAGLFDIANGMTTRVDPYEVAFPNVDLTAHLFRRPQGEWLGLDSRVSFAPDGIGLTSAVLHDEEGPVGTLAQILTVRPM